MRECIRIRNANAFIENAKRLLPDRDYDYSLVVDMYTNNRTKVCIIDNAINPKTGKPYGRFMVSPGNLLKGKGHPQRRGERISKAKSFTTDEYVRRCMEVHKDENLDYSNVVYKGAHEKVYIIDHDINPDTGEEYGGYWQEANSHLRGCVHPDKGRQKCINAQRLTIDKIREKISMMFPDKGYIIPDQEYINNRAKIKVVCPKHGEFMAPADALLAGKGCPVCGCSISKAEDEIYNYLIGFFDKSEIVRRCRNILSDNKEIDIYIPSRKVGIEYNGIRWHSEEFGKDRHYHIGKLEDAEGKGITLIQVFEDEYLMHKDIVLSKLRHVLGLDLGLPKVMARKCVVREIKRRDEAKEFLDRYHIQGYGSATVNLGCYHEGRLVAVMSFKQESRGMWNLTRFASNTNVVCQGVGSRLFKHFVREYDPFEVKTFLDRRWEHRIDDNLYVKMGFVVDRYEAPDYMYTDGRGTGRYHKFGFRKQILHRKYGLPLTMTEREMTEKLGYHKVWNCGLIRYIWKKEMK